VEIVKARREDLPAILEIYAYARLFMKATGNPNQWQDSHPARETLESDIESGNLYLCLNQQQIAGVFAFIIGSDPTYDIIDDGAWHSDKPYGTVHRLASGGQFRGIGRACFDYCKARLTNLRVDTHHDNKVMQSVIAQNGFSRCGIIYQPDGSPRIAYDWQAE
jgi:hypothetical protein